MNNEIDVYTCDNCGAEIIVLEGTTITSCIYCKNTAIVKNKLDGIFNPDYLIPFKTTKQDVINSFKKFSRCNWLMPKQFNLKKKINDISGIYVPCFVYNFNSTGVIETECNKANTWISKGYRYTKTDKYKSIRGGNISFENIPVIGTKKIEKNIINSIEPFDYKDIKEFNCSYLSGFLSERYNVSKEESKIEAIEIAKKSFIEEMKKDILNYDNITDVDNSINLYDCNFSYILLPVWFLNIKYKNKIYTLAMNGQTGKIVGDIPIDIKKAVLIWILLFIVIFVILLLLNLFKVSA